MYLIISCEIDDIEWHKHATLIRSIKNMFDHDWVFELVHTLLEGNQTADWLAKWGALQDETLHVFEQPPSGLGSLLL